MLVRLFVCGVCLIVKGCFWVVSGPFLAPFNADFFGNDNKENKGKGSYKPNSRKCMFLLVKPVCAFGA